MKSIRKPIHISLFAGCGGLSLGLYKSGWQGLFAIEKNKDAFLTLQHNLIHKKKHFIWPKWLPQKNLDINLVLKNYKNQLKKLNGEIDLVEGGPPCQGFSTAGRRQEADTRNLLIRSYIKFIKLVKPKVILFENVKGFTLEFDKNRDKGKKYSSYIKKELSNAGYYVRGELINFADYGIPQRRIRFILVGIRKDIKNSNQQLVDDFFVKIKDKRIAFLSRKKIGLHTNLREAISDLLMRNGTKDSPDTQNHKAGVYSRPLYSYQKLMRQGVRKKIANSHRFANHTKEIINRFEYILKESKRNKDIDSSIRGKFKIKKHTIIPLAANKKSPTLTTLPDDYIHYLEPRILTVREYARIQSFPDWFEFKGKYTTGGSSRKIDVPRYTQVGNAIPPLFAEQSGLILKHLI